MPAHFITPAPREKRHQLLPGIEPEHLFHLGPALGLGMERARGMPDPPRGGPSLLEERRFEVEQEQREIDVLAQPADSSATPRPDRGADVVNHALPHPFAGRPERTRKPARLDRDG